jgi:rubrerythrin
MDRISSIQFAIENEATEMVFYQKQADRTSSAVAKALFETLAHDEKEHMTRIRVLHEKLTSDGSWPDHVPIEVAGTDVMAVLEKARASADQGEASADDLEALNKGAKFEEKGAAFYGELADKCENPQEAKFFRFLSQIEREHMLSIKDSILYLEDPEGWFESKERAGLDGA